MCSGIRLHLKLRSQLFQVTIFFVFLLLLIGLGRYIRYVLGLRLKLIGTTAKINYLQCFLVSSVRFCNKTVVYYIQYALHTQRFTLTLFGTNWLCSNLLLVSLNQLDNTNFMWYHVPFKKCKRLDVIRI